MVADRLCVRPEQPRFQRNLYDAGERRGHHALTDDAQSSYSPAWSPDGTHIAFVSNRSGDGDIYVMDSDGQRPFLLTQDDNGAEDRTPAWSPDSRWIVFASNRENDQFRWYAVDLAGDIQPVTTNDRNPQSFSFSTR